MDFSLANSYGHCKTDAKYVKSPTETGLQLSHWSRLSTKILFIDLFVIFFYTNSNSGSIS